MSSLRTPIVIVSPFAKRLDVVLLEIAEKATEVVNSYAVAMLKNPFETLSVPSALNRMCDETAHAAVAKILRNSIQPQWAPADAYETLDMMANNEEIAQTPNLHAGYVRWVRAMRGVVRVAAESVPA